MPNASVAVGQVDILVRPFFKTDLHPSVVVENLELESLSHLVFAVLLHHREVLTALH